MSDTQPNPQVWPECPTCDAAYVLRRALVLSKGEWEWLWQRDCKHKSAPRKALAEGVEEADLV